jgi:type IV pilus biogenesis protein CpaD/CtpE
MRKPAYLVAAAAALSLLGACATEDRATPASTPVVVTPPAPVVATPPAAVVVPPSAAGQAVVVPSSTTLRAGTGRIESIAALPASAAAGGSASTTPTRRVGVKMDDGTLQFVDTAAPGLQIGDRIQLTADGYLRRPAP